MYLQADGPSTLINNPPGTITRRVWAAVFLYQCHSVAYKNRRPPDVTSHRGFCATSDPTMCTNTPSWACEMAPDSTLSHCRGDTKIGHQVATNCSPVARRQREGILSLLTLSSNCIAGKRATLHDQTGGFARQTVRV